MLANSRRQERARDDWLCYTLRAVQAPVRAAYLSFSVKSMWLSQIHNVVLGFLSSTSIDWVPIQLRGLPSLCYPPF